MLNSMTGYGESEGQLDGINYAVEIKTLNNRYLKTTIRVPESIMFLEEHVEKILRQNLVRGTVNYVLRLKETSGNALFEIDEKALEVLVQKLNKIGSAVDTQTSIDLAGLLGLPGIVKPAIPDKDMAERIKNLVTDITLEAINKLKQMRAAEGRSLQIDLMENCSKIVEDLKFIGNRSSTVVLDYAKRLKKRVDELLAEAKLKLDEETLAREVAVMADRSDISEEIARLDSHLKQFEIICNSDGQAAGRRLDFISQEMLREANTIASKATDADIVRSVVDIKCRVDRIKEQVQNIE